MVEMTEETMVEMTEETMVEMTEETMVEMSSKKNDYNQSILTAIDPNTPAERNALLDLLQDPRVGADESDIESITNCLEALLINTPT
jgi:hypothetical protein